MLFSGVFVLCDFFFCFVLFCSLFVSRGAINKRENKNFLLSFFLT